MFELPVKIKEVIGILNESGYEAYLVGGAVRDMFLGLTPSDYDLTTNAKPDEIEKVFKEYKTIDIGKKFGTILVIYENEEIEITTYRSDGKYIDGRRPEKITFSKELSEDLKRRDLTVNAMAYNDDKGLIDYFNGREDIKNKIIRTVGKPEKRFAEDYLRVLRTVRFANQLNFEIDDESYIECVKNAENLTKISNERIRDELFKILMCEKPSYGINLLKDMGILEIILPELYETIGFEQNNPHHDKDVYEHTLQVIDNSPKKLEIRLAALFHDLGKTKTYWEDEEGIGHFYGHDKVSRDICINVLRRFNSPKGLIDKVSNLVDSHMINNGQFKSPGIKRLINKFGEENIFDLMELQKADRKASSKESADISDIIYMEKKIREILSKEEVYDKKELAINGNHVIELGYNQGKKIGEILDFAYEMVLENPCYNKKEILIKKIKDKYKLEENLMATKLFGTDGIRGIANEDLTPELAFKTGRAAAYVLAKDHKGSVVIGKDTRASGDMLESAMAAGIASMGLDVMKLGVIPTPAVSHLTREKKALAGVVISASHNPGEYNGIKIFDGKGLKLPDEIEEEIEKYIFEPEKIEDRPIKDGIGRIREMTTGQDEYIDYLVSTIGIDLTGIKVAMDCGHGALYEIGPKTIERLNGEVIAINTEPDGININDNCGSTNGDLISQLVIEEKADIGLSFDGDADRIIAADEKGNIIDGDHILAICGSYLNEKGQLDKNTVVGTIMTNMGLDEYMEENGMKVVKTAVGDRYILEEMLDKGYVLGGEQSGHIIFMDYNTTGDGLATGLFLLKVALESNKKLSELNNLVTDYPQVLVNARVKEELKYSYNENKEINEEISRVEELFSGKGRVVIRPSGTEPLVRVMIEAKDFDGIDDIADELAKFIEERIGIDQ